MGFWTVVSIIISGIFLVAAGCIIVTAAKAHGEIDDV